MKIDPLAVLASRTFSTEDQERFARLSGDRNPMHMDAIAARRTQAGAPVVHGMHVALWCLDVLARQPSCPPDPCALQVRFVKPVYVGDTPSIELAQRSAHEITLRVGIAGTTLATLRVSFASGAAPVTARHSEVADIDGSKTRLQPRELRLEEMAGRTGFVRCAAPAVVLAQEFPAAAALAGSARLLGLAALSGLVGMECPGLHSIFAMLAVDFVPPSDPPGITYAVTEVDERFRLVRLRVEGSGIAGAAEAFVRQPPVRQMRMASVAGYVSPNEFVGQRVLIIGGSRGLGELTAKTIAAGGGHPVITYARGAADAEAVRREIADFGGRCESLPYDATEPAAPQLAALRGHPTQLYYFATGQIFRRKTGVFEAALLREFLAIYVAGFHDLCAALTSRSAAGLAIFYPSSIAIETRPRDLTEYAMAKAAGEILCADIGRALPGIRVAVKRLPRLLSDQTATVAPVDTAPAIDVLLPIIREVQAAPGTHQADAAAGAPITARRR